MVELIPPPDPRTLLPPLLACLPTAFISSRPPPALLSLLSPILRQRVEVLSSVSASSTDSWLRLLCWDPQKGERLQSLVDGANFEPHPVSGEIELPGDIPVAYRRLDEETLQSRVLIPDYNLQVVYLWCPRGQDETVPGWLVAELLPDEGGGETDGTWLFSIGEANAHAKEQLLEDALRAAESNELAPPQKEEEEEEDDDDYWARYDATPARTPSAKPPAPGRLSSMQQRHGPSESSYFDRYADVQPAMDSHDPEEEHPELGPTSLLGDIAAEVIKRNMENEESSYPDHPNDTHEMPLSHPRPSSVSSSSSVAKLEQEAANQSTCEVGVKQHIGSNIKSLFRLAKATGISRAEFQSIVRTELDLLNVSDHD
ncbi:hypothetical protein P175DRAFT_0496962 [Aspergillus ochraceoroseus IBT 24754]|uniref:Uncharacterized protein n=2 Tax=Aspergillus ochraceoroseus TaxID=138278 RepID=A0A2T5M5M5_9EURO|nr:uncharacterized protein P175DRAFT_0496962 [Aspergillus ochraceoroseus IBT 24754]KKK24572.1 hypothetical protein AOCH_000400 [Aspergillus ochraceoroseus]PTU23837.1 hypothetical protein P175DRAFT_0496962 [Aspergillus ochraceoroseus IBT 24754]